LLGRDGAIGQTSSPAPAPGHPSQQPAPTPGHPTDTPPEKVEDKPVPTSPVPEAPPGSLSDKLSKQKGVIDPPKGVDPEMHKAPADEGKMRVIPPPGSPGAPSDVQPK
jgi:hypothetical protein